MVLSGTTPALSLLSRSAAAPHRTQPRGVGSRGLGGSETRLARCQDSRLTGPLSSAAVNNQTNEGVAIKKVTNVFSKKILAKRALREIKLLQHFRGHRNVRLSTLSPYRPLLIAHC